MDLSVELLARIIPCSIITAETWHAPVMEAMGRYGILAKPRRVAAFLAQVSYESARLTRLVENLNYSAQRLMQVWPRRFPTLASAVPFAHSPEKLANAVYANRMGNGDAVSGDGWRYRGRGPKQITGRNNYSLMQRLLGLPLLDQPDLLRVPAYGALSAAAYWDHAGCSRLIDAGDYVGVTRAINGALIGHEDGNASGLDDRVELYEHACRLLRIEP
jgi:putative chitinase